MNTHAEKSPENNTSSAAANTSKQIGKPALQLADNRANAIAQKKMQENISKSSRVLQTKSKAPGNNPVAQLVRKEYKGINGLTHLVQMTAEGRLYTGDQWQENEREEVKSGDLLEVDMDTAVRSHRGIHQQSNWRADSRNDQPHLWVLALSLNHRPLGKDRYVRYEMLKDGYEPIPKKMHSIWVQGDYQQNPEAMEGLKARQDEHLQGWVNMIWLYDTGRGPHGFDPSLQKKTIQVDSHGFVEVYERSFIDEMRAWKESGKMPKWVDAWMRILEVLRAKKSYITMSDLMRMIILYYEGGVYMDVKIKVNPGHADFKNKPMLLINTANFYAHENWAIMANAGCTMIEEIMIQALHQFPSIEELQQYPENYQQGKGVEGKMHVELHERRGVWNVIEKYRNDHSYRTSLGLTNPRPVNSWAQAYDDRPADVIRKEKEEFRRQDIEKCRRELMIKEREKRTLTDQLAFSKNPSLWSRLGITEEMIKELPKAIENVTRQIEMLQMELDHLEHAPIDDDGNGGMSPEELEAQLALLDSLH